MTSNSVELSHAGTYVYEESYASNGTTSSVSKTNVRILNKATGEQIYLNDMVSRTYTTGASYYEYVEHNELEGRIYLSAHGYVQVQSSDDLIIRDSTSAPIEKGSISLTGASNSKARIRNVYDYDDYYYGIGLDTSRYRVDLDEDGDGVFELSSLQSGTGNAEFETFANQPPTAVIENADYYSEDAYLTEDSEIRLDASSSTDADFDQITYKWTVEERPEGSTSQIDNSDEATTYFTLDVRGKYKISLKVTDSYGASAITFLEINSGDKPPKLEFSFSGFRVTTDDGVYVDVVPLGSDVAVTVRASDHEESYDHDYDIKWSFSIPAASNLNLNNNITDQSWNTDYSRVDFSPGKEGVYEFTVTATDSSGLEGTETYSFSVKNLPPVAVIEGNTNFAKVGQGLELRSESRKVGVDDAELTYLWKIVSAPSGSTPSFDGLPADINGAELSDVYIPLDDSEILLDADDMSDNSPDGLIIMPEDDISDTPVSSDSSDLDRVTFIPDAIPMCQDSCHP